MSKLYNIIYADPPWEYEQKSTGNGNVSGAADKYNTMKISDIQALPIKNIIDNDAVLFLWATVPLLSDAMTLFPAWGFKYKSLIVWEKTGVYGMGNWVRIQEELLLFGVRGKVKPFKHQEKNIYRHPVCDHSAKPHFFRELIMKLPKFEKQNRLELFARSRKGMFQDYEYEGWDVFGNEVNNSIKIE